MEACEQPQEMRDVFAAAACIGLLIDAKESTLSPSEDISTASWDLSDAIMVERSKRIKARKAAQDGQSRT